MTLARAPRVLLADDSDVVRLGLRRGLGPVVEVVGEARTAAEALEQLEQLRPDVVVVGLELPGGGAAQVLERARRLGTGVVALAAAPPSGALARALESGSITMLEKPATWDARRAAALQERVFAADRARVEPAPVRAPRAVRHPAPAAGRLLAVGASTGGPPEVARLLAGLPVGTHVPVVVVQHTDAGAIASLAEWLAKSSGLPVSLASDGERLGPGDVRLAPAGRHLVVNRAGRLELQSPVNAALHVPSVDALLVSLAEHLGPRGGGVILSGMGDDGSRGLAALRDAGGATWVQAPETAAAPGMPAAALAALGAGRPMAMPRLVRAIRAWMEDGWV